MAVLDSFTQLDDDDDDDDNNNNSADAAAYAHGDHGHNTGNAVWPAT